ncbi:hypothetical protein [Filimonas lacunae]|uniref:hypothetical protein n=1 Tax=Filimonas lacunae TaxID=477680 RepID=UPI0007D7352D|nr:hypothetical protein [Filimonas lacunae]BAV08842.1 hypothetical protein FLA_4889 [Filimonas lacunae]
MNKQTLAATIANVSLVLSSVSIVSWFFLYFDIWVSVLQWPGFLGPLAALVSAIVSWCVADTPRRKMAIYSSLFLIAGMVIFFFCLLNALSFC